MSAFERSLTTRWSLVFAFLFTGLICMGATLPDSMIPDEGCLCTAEFRHVGGGWEARCNGNCPTPKLCKPKDAPQCPVTSCETCSCCIVGNGGALSNCEVCDDLCHAPIKKVSTIVQPPECSAVKCPPPIDDCWEPDADPTWDACQCEDV